MKNKKALILITAGLLTASAVTGCAKTDDASDNADAEQTQNLSGDDVYSAAGAEINIEKSDLAADDRLYEEMKKINAAGYGYYNDRFKTDGFISNYGYLYSLTEDKIITVDDIVNEGYYELPEGMERMAEADFLLLMPKDVINNGVNVLDADFACFYTSIRTEEGVFISSPEDEGGMMSYENFRNMLLEYIPEHGEIVYPERNDENYIGIIDAVNEKTGTKKDYDVKHMVCDEKYAVAILGSMDDITDIKGYILSKEDGKWVVSYDKLEKMKDIIAGINMHFPDLAAEMIPKYSIAANGEIRTDLDKFISGIVSSGVISEDDLPIVYGCGTGQYVYAEFESGVKIVGGVNEKNELECYEVNNAAEAVKVMREFSQSAPIYIIKMNF